MSIIIDVESTNVETRNKKNGGTYQVQEVFVHTVDRNGNPMRYPERAVMFPPRDNQGNGIPYKVGQYVLSDQSIRVNNGFIELGFPTLTPVSEATKK